MPNLKYQWRRLRNKLKRNKIRRLPVELCLLIIELVEQREDLYTLLFVCRDFHSTAEKVLYSNIHLKGQQWHPHPPLFQAIISSERLACKIQSLTISSGVNFVTAKIYWNTFHQALRATHNLKELYWLPPDTTWPSSTLCLFPGCTFRLHTLVFHAYYSAHIVLDPAFLALQTELVELDLRSFCRISLPPNVFPKLTILTICCSETAHFINRPSLRALHVPEPYFSITDPLPAPLLVTSVRLPYFGASVNFPSIIHACRCLRFLRIDNIMVTRRARVQSLPLYQIFVQIGQLAALEKLSLHFLLKQTQDRLRRIREMAFTHLKNIQVITAEEGSTDMCVQWLRGSEGQEVVKANEEEWRDKSWH